MTLIFVALGAFIVGVAVASGVGIYWLRVGFQLGRDDRALDPGEVTGRLPSALPPETPPERTVVVPAVEPVGESSGPRHAKPEPEPDPELRVWPVGDADTKVLEPVDAEVKA